MQVFKEELTENRAKRLAAEIRSAESNTAVHHSMPACPLQPRCTARMLRVRLQREQELTVRGAQTHGEQLGSLCEVGAQALDQRSHQKSVPDPPACADTWWQGLPLHRQGWKRSRVFSLLPGDATYCRARPEEERRRGQQQTSGRLRSAGETNAVQLDLLM